MSCACQNMRLSKELERVRRLAKVYAALEGRTAVIYRRTDGIYGFMPSGEETDNEIVEYVTPY